MSKTTDTKETGTMNAVPTNEHEAGNERIYSAYAPHYQRNNHISRNVTWDAALAIALNYDALVYLTVDADRLPNR